MAASIHVHELPQKLRNNTCSQLLFHSNAMLLTFWLNMHTSSKHIGKSQHQSSHSDQADTFVPCYPQFLALEHTPAKDGISVLPSPQQS